MIRQCKSQQNYLLKQIVTQLKNHKSAGVVEVPFDKVPNQRITGQLEGERHYTDISKRGKKIYPKTYKRITLLNGIGKLFTKVTLELLNEHNNKEGTNRAWVQEKSITRQLNLYLATKLKRPQHTPFSIHMLHRFHLQQGTAGRVVMSILQEFEFDSNLRPATKELYTNTKTCIRVVQQTSQQILVYMIEAGRFAQPILVQLKHERDN